MGNFLILGKGFIGNALKEQIPDAMIVSRSEIDYLSPSELLKLIEDNNITTVVNCAGYTGKPNVDACEINKEDCYNLNVIAPVTIHNTISQTSAKLIHISSGCIYDGYSSIYSEDDTPNFGIFSNHSSFYSKTKHMAETLLNHKDNVAVVRLRIPFDWKKSSKNYFTKLLNYDDLIDYVNSKTDVRYLCRFIEHLGMNFTPGVFNAVHGNAMTTSRVVDVMREFGLNNPNWKFVPYESIRIVANRSNCMLKNDKVRNIGFYFPTEEVAIREALEKYTNQ